MATIDVAVGTDLAPEQAWKLASDLHRFDEWLTIFGGWRSEVPSEVEVGTTVSSAIKVKGFRNVIHWRVTRYDEPKAIELVGRGKPAICIALRLCVKEVGAGSGIRRGTLRIACHEPRMGLISPVPPGSRRTS